MVYRKQVFKAFGRKAKWTTVDLQLTPIAMLRNLLIGIVLFVVVQRALCDASGGVTPANGLTASTGKVLLSVSNISTIPLANHGSHSSGNDHEESAGGHSHHGVELASVNMPLVETPLTIVLFVLGIALGKALYCRMEVLQDWVPESCILITIGSICGIILFYADPETWSKWHLDTTAFFLYLLPPIMLEAGYGLHDRTFFDNIGSILLYAVAGTVMAFFSIGLAIWGISASGAMGVELSLMPSLMFSSWIVAVDPVAILAIFQDLGVDRTLYLLVFGESLLNDGVTVVLYNVMRALCGLEEVTGLDVFLGVLSFFTVALGGMIIGVIVGAVCAFILRFTHNIRLMEAMITLVMAYFSYVLAMLFDWSGIISVVACGLMQAQYSFPNIHPKSSTTVKYVSKMAASISESFIFLFLGLELVSDRHIWNTGFCLWSLIFCLLFRFIVTFVLTAIINAQSGRVRKITLTEQLIMGYGGLRGAIAFALAVMVDQRLLEPVEKSVFVTATLFIILFTTFLQGLLTKPMVKLLGIRLEPEKVLSLHKDLNYHLQDHIMSGIEAISGKRGSNYVRQLGGMIDDFYIKRALLRDPTSRDQEIMDVFEKLMLKMHYASLKPGNVEKLPTAMERALIKCGSTTDFTLLANAASLNSRLLRPLSVDGSDAATVLDVEQGASNVDENKAYTLKLHAAMQKSAPNTVPLSKLRRSSYVDEEDLPSQYLQELKRKNFVIYRLHKMQLKQSRCSSLQNIAASAAGVEAAPGRNKPPTLNATESVANGEKCTTRFYNDARMSKQMSLNINAKNNLSPSAPPTIDENDGNVVPRGFNNQAFDNAEI